MSLAALFAPSTCFSQSWGGRGKPSFWDKWTINGNVGLTSFFGDLSLYDSDITGKLTKESAPALSAILTKRFSDKIGISGQLLYGGLKGENASGMSFEANIVEYNFHGRIELINLISPNNLSNFGIEAYAGVGQFIFKVTQWDMRDGESAVNEHFTGVPEFVYFAGAGIYYNISDKIGFTADMALRQAQNDKLDDFNKNENFDYYTHLAFGVTYYIDSFKKSNGFSRGRSTRGKPSGRLPMRRRR